MSQEHITEEEEDVDAEDDAFIIESTRVGEYCLCLLNHCISSLVF